MVLSISATGFAGNIDIPKLMQDCNPVETEKKPDGSVLLTCSDRSTITQTPHGPIEIYYPLEEKTVSIDPSNGKIVKTVGKGWVATPLPDGRVEIKYNSGEIAYVDEKNKTIVRISANGKTRTAVDLQKCTIGSETQNPDGSKTLKYADRTVSYITVSGFVPTTYYSDGRIAFGDGKPIPINMDPPSSDDQTIRIPYGDGNFLLKFKNGTAKLELYDARGKIASIEEFLVPEPCAGK
jgi:hypothetical protein